MEARPYTINGSWVLESTVVKLFYGPKKYVVVKSKKEFDTLKAIEKQLASFLRGNPLNPGSMYSHLFVYVKKHPDLKFKVVNQLTSESGYELLKKEQELLDEGRKSKVMLNNNTDAYVPLYNVDTQMYGWITKNEFLNFEKWKKSRKSRKKRNSA